MSTSISSAPRLIDRDRRFLGGRFGFGQRIAGLVVDGIELRAPVFNENEVRRRPD